MLTQLRTSLGRFFLTLLMVGFVLSHGIAIGQELDPGQNAWLPKYAKQKNAPKPGDMLLNTDDEPDLSEGCLLYTSPSPRDKRQSRMPSSA